MRLSNIAHNGPGSNTIDTVKNHCETSPIPVKLSDWLSQDVEPMVPKPLDDGLPWDADPCQSERSTFSLFDLGSGNLSESKTSRLI